MRRQGHRRVRWGSLGHREADPECREVLVRGCRNHRLRKCGRGLFICLHIHVNIHRSICLYVDISLPSTCRFKNISQETLPGHPKEAPVPEAEASAEDGDAAGDKVTPFTISCDMQLIKSETMQDTIFTLLNARAQRYYVMWHYFSQICRNCLVWRPRVCIRA